MAGKRKDRKQKIQRKFMPVTGDAPFQFQEAFKSLRTNLKFMALNNDCKSIEVTSAILGEGKSSVAINLAISLAETGSKVLLMDCDLRRPIVHHYLKLDKKAYKGITHALTGGSLKESVIAVEPYGLHVMIVDAIPPNPAELLGSKRMGSLLANLRKFYDYIILDTPPCAVVTDAAVLSQYTDGVLLVVKQNHSTFDEAAAAKRNLETVNANILGVVLNDFDVRRTTRDNGYYYSYGYEYKEND